MRLDDAAYVREQYATEHGLAARAAVYHGGGPDARALVVAALREAAPWRVLEVGCGWGELADWIVRDVGCELVATDQSERMVELAAGRGLDARVADVQELPFADGEFDAAVAAWMLYHVSDLERGLAELARVLRPGGRLVAVTNGIDHFAELWRLVGREVSGPRLRFRAENGAELLGCHFADVARHDLRAPVTFPDDDAVRRYVSSTRSWAAFVDAVPPFDGPFVATKVNAVFVAKKAA